MADSDDQRSLFAILLGVALFAPLLAISVVPFLPLPVRQAAHLLLALFAGELGLLGALAGELASIRASLLKPGHLWPWQARTGTKPLGFGKYLVVVTVDLLFGFAAALVVYGEHVGLNFTWKGVVTLFFAGMSGPEILHRLGGTVRK